LCRLVAWGWRECECAQTVGLEAEGERSGGRGGHKRYRVGGDVSLEAGRVTSPLEEGVVANWEVVRALWETAVEQRLGLNAAEHGVVVAESALASRADRERWCQMLFEEFKVPRVFLAKQGVLTAFGMARTTGFVIDVGYHATTLTPVQEGFPLMMGFRKSPVGLATMDDYCRRLCFSHISHLHPRSSSSSSSSEWPESTASYQWAHFLGRVVREKHFRVSPSPLDGSWSEGGGEGGGGAASASASASSASSASSWVRLPDGREVDVSGASMAAPELLFDASGAAIPGGASLARTAVDALMNCEGDARRDIGASTIFTGGGATLPGLEERFMRELAVLATVGVHVDHVGRVPAEACLGPFLGGSIVGSLPSFSDMCLSRAEWLEHGATMLHSKIA
jgi:Actin